MARLTKAQIEREHRLKRVAQYRALGMSIIQIADALEVHRNTISKDVAELEKRKENLVRESRVEKELGDHLVFLEQVEQNAMSEYHSCEKASDRSNFLNIALRSRGMKIELQTNTGVIPKAASKVEIEQLFKTESGADIRNMSASELEELEKATIIQLSEERRKRSGKGNKDEKSDDAKAA